MENKEVPVETKVEAKNEDLETKKLQAMMGNSKPQEGHFVVRYDLISCYPLFLFIFYLSLSFYTL